MSDAALTNAAVNPRPVNPWIVAASVMVSTFMVVLDTTVVNVSLPYIAGDLSASIDESTWTLTAYLAANAIILPMTGFLSTWMGRRQLLLASVAGFTLTSLLCGLAPSMPVLVIFRILQGAAGGTLQPISQAVLLEAFPPQDRGKAMSFWGLGIVVAPILGPVLGGWLTENWSWRWVFYINLPVGILAFVLTQLFIHDPPYLRRASTAIDAMGLSLLAIGIGALQIVLDKGQDEDWFASHLISVLAVVAVVGLVWFVVHESRARAPVVDLRVYADRTYATGSALMLLVMFVLFASLVLLPVMLQTLFGYPALQAGMAMAPRGIGSFIGMPLVGLLMARLDPRKLLAAGLAVGAITLFWFGQLDLRAGYWDFFWPQLIQGVALSLLFVPLTTLTMDPIAPPAMGNAASLFNLLRNIGGSFGIATTTTLLERHSQALINRFGAHVDIYGQGSAQMISRLVQGFVSRGVDPVTARQQAMAAMFGMVRREASLLSFIQMFRMLGVLFLLMLPLVFLLAKPRHQSGGGPMVAD